MLKNLVFIDFFVFFLNFWIFFENYFIILIKIHYQSINIMENNVKIKKKTNKKLWKIKINLKFI